MTVFSAKVDSKLESRQSVRRGRDRVLRTLADIEKNRTLVYEVVRFFAWGFTLVLAVGAFVHLPSEPALFSSFAIYSAFGSAVFLALAVVNISSMRDHAGRYERDLGWANKLTFVRFLLVAPIVHLVVHDRMVPALVVYALSGVTDIVDGIVARRTRRETEFGAVMDPVADIATTVGLFAAFFARGFVPAWVFIVLIARYASLLVGAVVLYCAVGPVKFKATPVGKIVGVLQAAAGILIIALSQTDFEWRDRFGWVLYPFLGIIFGSVIVSQLVIGARYIKKGKQYAGS